MKDILKQITRNRINNTITTITSTSPHLQQHLHPHQLQLPSKSKHSMRRTISGRPPKHSPPSSSPEDDLFNQSGVLRAVPAGAAGAGSENGYGNMSESYTPASRIGRMIVSFPTAPSRHAGDVSRTLQAARSTGYYDSSASSTSSVAPADSDSTISSTLDSGPGAAGVETGPSTDPSTGPRTGPSTGPRTGPSTGPRTGLNTGAGKRTFSNSSSTLKLPPGWS